MSKKVVIYTYYQTDVSNYNLSFFLKNEVIESEEIDYIFIINGYECKIKHLIPKFSNVLIILRENKGFDFGGYNAALNYLNKIGSKYDFYIFMNSGVFGPVIKKGLCDNQHWSDVFTNKINDKVKLVGTSIVCLPSDDLGGFGPKVEAFFFVTDQIGLDLCIKEGTIFCDHKNKTSLIVNGEYGVSRCIFKHNYTIDCILDKYQNIDWTNTKNWGLNNNKHPSRKNLYFGKSINPYDVIFHKWYLEGEEKINFDIIEKYVNEINDVPIEKILVLFVFHEYNDRVKNFIDNCIFKDDNIDFIIICNNKKINFTSPDYVKVIKRDNIGYDFGGWSDALLKDNLYKKYNKFIFANSSIVGPYLRKDFPGKWTDVYLNGLNNCELFGSTINICNNKFTKNAILNYMCRKEGCMKFSINDLPHVQSFIFSVNKKTLQLLIDNGVFSITKYVNTFMQAIINKEIYMSRVIINNNYRIGSLLNIYKDIDFRKQDCLNSLPEVGDLMYNQYENKLWKKEELVFIKGNRT